MPTRHWSNRTPWDKNETLWGAFVLQAGGRQVYFGGDSGYGSHFREVRRLFPGLDAALIGAGAYAPRWIMALTHQDPAHAVQAFHDTGAKVLVPMHYGTFNLSGELSHPACCKPPVTQSSCGANCACQPWARACFFRLINLENRLLAYTVK